MTDYRRERQSYESRAGGRLRWDDCVKRDVKKTGEEGDCKKKTRDRGGWKRLSDKAVKKCGQHLTPDKGKKRKREMYLEYHKFERKDEYVGILYEPISS